jgi:hypothetical protein
MSVYNALIVAKKKFINVRIVLRLLRADNIFCLILL